MSRYLTGLLGLLAAIQSPQLLLKLLNQELLYSLKEDLTVSENLRADI